MSEPRPNYTTRAQTIFRVEKNADNPFVMMDRRPLEKSDLSWGAKGLLAYLLSRPDNWVVRFQDLVNRSPDGAHKVRGFMKELRAAGHVRVITHREGGRIVEWEYKVFEVPPDGDFQQVEKQQVENRTFNDNKKSLTKRKVNKVAKPPTPKEPKPEKPAEVSLYRTVTKKFPPEANTEQVTQLIRAVSNRLGKEVTAEDLRPYYQAWTANGWNQFSINWLEYAVKGELPRPQFKQQVKQAAARFIDPVTQFLNSHQEEIING